MYDRILLPIDGSDGARRTIDHVADIAADQDASVTALFVADTTLDSVTRIEGDIVESLVETGEEIVGEAGTVLASSGVDYETDVVSGGPARTVVDYADRYGFDLIAMPTHGRTGISRRLLGSVTETVIRLSQIPVLTIRLADETRTTFPYERLLVPTDGSPAATAAVEHGLDLAAALDGTPHALSVAESGSVLGLGGDGSNPQSAAETAVENVEPMASERDIGTLVTAVEHGSPHEAITAYVDANDIDAIVMGTTGTRGIGEMLLGTVAELVVRTAPVPVITVTAEE
ncbi:MULTISPECIES: universal stress protein [Halomicrobium]|uniref:UspA domain protein n=2 Tax=Halomicrobium mukohataei TaxID=57705 RepID=C7P0D9_HALMD|nr:MULTISPECIES: universal stress protein [Halomicrobium]ACV48931.1 UspA domain protein [Halomicrobium mukohataei DSM 12286]QCD64355.1 universal stress protein [Halomicrobium mukohataei]QFR19161.1 universal stress protein [Halomicrobium sp. ZPS1]